MREVLPETNYQQCTAHFYCNVFSVTPRSKVKLRVKMLKAIHAQQSRIVARLKAKSLGMALRQLRPIEIPLGDHWTRIRTRNAIERLNQDIRSRIHVAGCFPDGNPDLCLAAPCGKCPMGQQENGCLV